MELGQVGGVQCLITEHTVDGEHFDGLELVLLGHFVQHSSADGCGVGPKVKYNDPFLLKIDDFDTKYHYLSLVCGITGIF